MTPPGRTLVFDCFSGIAGDMTLAALLDAGASIERVREGLATLGLPPFTVDTERVSRGGIEALHLLVEVPEERAYQPAEMHALVAAAGLPERVKARVLAAMEALAAGEAAAHRTAAPHLHEAGGVDAVIDIVGTMLALEELGIADAACPLVTVGSATIVKSEHGPLPAAPGPAAAAILQQREFAVRFVEAAHELVTPTGAAILAAVARPGPATVVLKRQGAGAGTYDPPGRPNALRVFIGDAVSAPAPAATVHSPLAQRQIVELSANVDDMPASLLAHARDRLMEEGALDAWIESIGMKKGRAASKLCALVTPDEEHRFAALFLRETTTLGVRVTPFRRYEAERQAESFVSTLGEVRVKVSVVEGHRRAAPEFEDVKALAARLDRPALEVQRLLEAELLASFAGDP